MAENTIIIDSPRDRCGGVQQLLSPLRPGTGRQKTPVAAHVVLRSRSGEAVVAAADSPQGQSYRDWLFRTASKEILGQYFEEWASPNGMDWQLSQACLHLFKRVPPPGSPKEILALHCEPRELGDSIQARLKRGPHIHLKPAGYPLGKAHLPLNYGHLAAVLVSLDTLTQAMTDAVQIALIEVLDADWD